MTGTAPLVHAGRLTPGRGFKVELLLAEPSWILPARRSELLAIIGRLKAVPYDGLHLDLEPAQLDSAPEKAPQLLGSLAERSEERRVGKEGRSRGSPYHSKKK